jgi:hypothetical protein
MAHGSNILKCVLIVILVLASTVSAQITVSQTLSKEEVNVSESVAVTVAITNLGDESKVVEVTSILPSGVSAASRSNDSNLDLWKGYIKPEKTELVTFAVKPERTGVFNIFSIVRYRENDSNFSEIYLSSQVTAGVGQMLEVSNQKNKIDYFVPSPVPNTLLFIVILGIAGISINLFYLIRKR